jgi:hypothetical protein
MNVDSLVTVKAVGVSGRVGDVSGDHFRVDFPTGTWGWHTASELAPAPLGFSFAEAKASFGVKVAAANWEHRKALLGFFGHVLKVEA